MCLTKVLLCATLCSVSTFGGVVGFVVVACAIAVIVCLIFPAYRRLQPASFRESGLLAHVVAGCCRLSAGAGMYPSVRIVKDLTMVFASFRYGKAGAFK